MATNKKQVADPVQPAVAPAQPEYQAYPTQYVPVDPNKGKAKLLTLEYLFAMGSAIGSVLLSISVLVKSFGIWTGISSAGSSSISGLAPDMTTPGTGIIAAGVLAVLLAVLSLILFGRVSKAIPDRAGYTSRTAYKLITYGGFGVLLISTISSLAKIITILISSLLFIGVSEAGEVYKSLYLAEFLPYLLGLALLAFAVWSVYKIVSGVNKSKILAWVLVAASIAVMLAGSITVAVKVHDTKKVRALSDYYSKIID